MEFLVLLVGEADAPMTAHIHAECVFGDVFASAACGCRDDRQTALDALVLRGGGALVHRRDPQLPDTGPCGGPAARLHVLLGTSRPSGVDPAARLAQVLTAVGLHTVTLPWTPTWVGEALAGQGLDVRRVTYP